MAFRFPKDGRIHFTHTRCRVRPGVLDLPDTVEIEDVTSGQRYTTEVPAGTGATFIRDTFGLEPVET